jgi:hypothetical protein
MEQMAQRRKKEREAANDKLFEKVLHGSQNDYASVSPPVIPTMPPPPTPMPPMPNIPPPPPPINPLFRPARQETQTAWEVEVDQETPPLIEIGSDDEIHQPFNTSAVVSFALFLIALFLGAPGRRAQRLMG